MAESPLPLVWRKLQTQFKKAEPWWYNHCIKCEECVTTKIRIKL